MRPAGLVGLWFAAALAAQAPARVQVEQSVAPATAWQQEPLLVTVRVGIDRAWFAEHGAPLLLQPLDLPFVMSLPWLGEPTLSATVEVPAKGRTTAVDGRVVTLEVENDSGDGWAWHRLRARLTPPAAGPLRLAPANVRYGFAERFETDLLNGRHAVDHQEAQVASAAVEVVVRPLPSPAPAGFFGAVGEFSLVATVATATIAVGGSVACTLTLAGDGNLAAPGAPPWPELPGFVVQGLVERRRPGAREFVFDLLALREGSEAVPPLSCVVFSPRAGSYVTLVSRAVPLRVVANREPAALPARVRELIASEQERLATRPWWHFGLPALGLVGIVGWRIGRRRRARRRDLAAAGEAVRLAITTAPTDAAAAFARLCELALPGVAADAAALRSGLQRRGADAALVENVLALQAQLSAVRYGGPLPAVAGVVATLQQFVAFCARRA